MVSRMPISDATPARMMTASPNREPVPTSEFWSPILSAPALGAHAGGRIRRCLQAGREMAIELVPYAAFSGGASSYTVLLVRW